jgi:hypothetical protein
LVFVMASIIQWFESYKMFCSDLRQDKTILGTCFLALADTLVCPYSVGALNPLAPFAKGGIWRGRTAVRPYICAELLCGKAGGMFAGTPAGEYAVGNGDAAGKVAIAADSHSIPPHGIETSDG